MAQKWYPVIDYMGCIGCGSCTRKCSHGVYDLTKAPTPVVVNPIGCVDHCHGCGNLCPQGAITYVGEDTGWTSPNGSAQAEESCGCDCACDTAQAEKKVRVEYLYLDLQICDRCIGTDAVLEEALTEVTPALNAAGYQVEYQKIEISSAQIAEKYHFLSSPTVLVNGQSVLRSKRTPAAVAVTSVVQWLTAVCLSMRAKPTKFHQNRCLPKRFCVVHLPLLMKAVVAARCPKI